MHISEKAQKVLLAVGTGLALLFSIAALVVSLNAGDGHHGRGHMGEGPQGMMFGGPVDQHGPGNGYGGPGGQPGQGGGFGGPGQGGPRQGMIAPGAGQVAPNGSAATTTTK